MKYLRKFDTQGEYDNYLSSPEFVRPNVSLVGDKVYYHAEDMKLLPLFVEAIEPLTVSFSVNPIEYSLDNRTWRILPVGESTPTIGARKRVYFRASGLTASSVDGIGTFSTTGKFNVGGNIMSMAYGADFGGKVELYQNYQFYIMFRYALIVDARNLCLPATLLSDDCYRGLFQYCYDLVYAPELPAMNLSNSCYRGTFYQCTSLVNAPNLPATNIADYCYNVTFYGCINLKNGPAILPATTLKQYCYAGTFEGCVNLENAPILPAQTLVSRCYNVLFKDCAKIQYIKAMFLTTPQVEYTNAWVYGVASGGVFVKNSKATWNVQGTHGIPSGWTIELADE